MRKGFSIIETLLAAFVLSVGLVGVISIFGPINTASREATHRVVAAALAQEGIELVRNIRDNNMIAGKSIDHNMSLNSWRCIDYNDTALRSCNGVLSRTSSGFFHHGSGSDTPYRRWVRVERADSDTLNITTMVTWGNTSRPSRLNQCTAINHCTHARSTLKNWH